MWHHKFILAISVTTKSGSEGVFLRKREGREGGRGWAKKSVARISLTIPRYRSSV